MCRHLADSSRVVPLFVDRLQLHVGSRDSALEAARVDLDQYVVTAVIDPATMTLVDQALCVAFPRILEGRNRARLLKLYTQLRPGGGEGEGGNVVACLTRTISELIPNPATPTDLATAWSMLCKLVGSTATYS